MLWTLIPFSTVCLEKLSLKSIIGTRYLKTVNSSYYAAINSPVSQLEIVLLISHIATISSPAGYNVCNQIKKLILPVI